LVEGREGKEMDSTEMGHRMGCTKKRGRGGGRAHGGGGGDETHALPLGLRSVGGHEARDGEGPVAAGEGQQRPGGRVGTGGDHDVITVAGRKKEGGG